jgi:hypothetical protein
MSIPSLSIRTDKLSDNSKRKIEALASDLSKLDLESSVNIAARSSIPSFQRQVFHHCIFFWKG